MEERRKEESRKEKRKKERFQEYRVDLRPEPYYLSPNECDLSDVLELRGIVEANVTGVTEIWGNVGAHVTGVLEFWGFLVADVELQLDDLSFKLGQLQIAPAEFCLQLKTEERNLLVIWFFKFRFVLQNLLKICLKPFKDKKNALGTVVVFLAV